MVSHINVFVPRMMEWVSSQHDCLQIIFPNHGRLVLRAFQIREQLAKPGHFPRGFTDALGLRTGQRYRRLALAQPVGAEQRKGSTAVTDLRSSAELAQSASA